MMTINKSTQRRAIRSTMKTRIYKEISSFEKLADDAGIAGTIVWQIFTKVHQRNICNCKRMVMCWVYSGIVILQ